MTLRYRKGAVVMSNLQHISDISHSEHQIAFKWPDKSICGVRPDTKWGFGWLYLRRNVSHQSKYLLSIFINGIGRCLLSDGWGSCACGCSSDGISVVGIYGPLWLALSKSWRKLSSFSSAWPITVLNGMSASVTVWISALALIVVLLIGIIAINVECCSSVVWVDSLSSANSSPVRHKVIDSIM